MGFTNNKDLDVRRLCAIVPTHRIDPYYLLTIDFRCGFQIPAVYPERILSQEETLEELEENIKDTVQLYWKFKKKVDFDSIINL